MWNSSTQEFTGGECRGNEDKIRHVEFAALCDELRIQRVGF